MFITTTETIPGKNILASLGIARGSTVRARNVGKDIFARKSKSSSSFCNFRYSLNTLFFPIVH